MCLSKLALKTSWKSADTIARLISEKIYTLADTLANLRTSCCVLTIPRVIRFTYLCQNFLCLCNISKKSTKYCSSNEVFVSSNSFSMKKTLLVTFWYLELPSNQQEFGVFVHLDHKDATRYTAARRSLTSNFAVFGPVAHKDATSYTAAWNPPTSGLVTGIKTANKQESQQPALLSLLRSSSESNQRSNEKETSLSLFQFMVGASTQFPSAVS